VPGQKLVLITVAPLAQASTAVAAVELDVQRLPQDHLPLAAHHPLAMVIMAMVTRDLALS
jgi:hypothetical protein